MMPVESVWPYLWTTAVHSVCSLAAVALVWPEVHKMNVDLHCTLFTGLEAYRLGVPRPPANCLGIIAVAW